MISELNYYMINVWYGMVWYGMVRCGVVWRGVAWCGVARYGMVWHGMVQPTCKKAYQSHCIYMRNSQHCQSLISQYADLVSVPNFCRVKCNLGWLSLLTKLPVANL